MAPYTSAEWVLDRLQIEEKLNRLFQAIDARQWEQLIDGCFTPNTLRVDYSAVFHQPPYNTTGRELMEEWKPRVEKLDGGQHLLTSVCVDLPLVGGVEKPDKVKASAYGIVSMEKRSGVVGGNTFHDGNKYEFELERMTPDVLGNPWRVTFMKCIGLWSEGNMALLMLNKM